MAGPSHALSVPALARVASMVASSTPAARPRQPACAAATTLPASSANSTGMQSAIFTTQTVPRSRATAASACTSAVVRSASITLAPCTWCSQRGSAGSSARSSLRPASLPMSPIAAVVASAPTWRNGHEGKMAGVLIFLDFASAQAGNQLLEVARQRRLPHHRFARLRMRERELGGVQRLAREIDATARAAPGHGVAAERMVDVLQMHADLVRAPGLQAAFHQSGAAEALDHAVRGARGLAAIRHRHARALAHIAAHRRIDRAACRRVALHQREIDAPHAALR